MKTVSTVKLFESYEFHASHVIGKANSSLTWIICNNFAVSPVAPTLATGQPHSTEHGSVKLEMVYRLPHTHNLYAKYNMTVNRNIVEATLGKQYVTMIATLKCAGKGRGA